MAADSNNNISNNVYPLIKVQDKNTEKVTVTPDKSFSLRGFTFKEDSSDYADINLILKWDKPKKNVDIYKYKIYCNDEYLCETNERIFRCLGHERDENYYNYKVVALDTDGNILATSNFFTI